MNLSRLFILRPVATSLLMLALFQMNCKLDKLGRLLLPNCISPLVYPAQFNIWLE